MRRNFPFFVIAVCVLLLTFAVSALAQTPLNRYCDQPESIECQLATAQVADDLALVEQIVRQNYTSLGSRLGQPEQPTEYIAVSFDNDPLQRAQILEAYKPYIDLVELGAWWRDRPTPPNVPRPLRDPADAVIGMMAARRAGAADPERLLTLAREAADYLLFAQAEAGTGVFPFPDLLGRNTNVAAIANDFLAFADANGLAEQAMNNGWIADDFGGGELYFDNGLAGVAVLTFYEATGESPYLQSGLAAADWALLKPPVPNWVDNAQHVYLLARAYRLSGDVKYLDGAKRYARIGIFPGQLTDGEFVGRWGDPTNATVSNHYVIVRGLGELLAVLPESDAELPQVRDALRLALNARNNELIANGAASPMIVLGVLSQLKLYFPLGSTRLADEGRSVALDITARYATAQTLNGVTVMGAAGAWGLYLEAVGAG